MTANIRSSVASTSSNRFKPYMIWSVISVTVYSALSCLVLGLPATIEMVQSNPKLLLIFPLAILLLSLVIFIIEAVGAAAGTILPYIVQTPPSSNKMTRPSTSTLDMWAAQLCATFRDLMTQVDQFLNFSFFSNIGSQENTRTQFTVSSTYSIAVKHRLKFNLLMLFFPRKNPDTPNIA